MPSLRDRLTNESDPNLSFRYPNYATRSLGMVAVEDQIEGRWHANRAGHLQTRTIAGFVADHAIDCRSLSKGNFCGFKGALPFGFSTIVNRRLRTRHHMVARIWERRFHPGGRSPNPKDWGLPAQSSGLRQYPDNRF